jgi:hypothetical protein
LDSSIVPPVVFAISVPPWLRGSLDILTPALMGDPFKKSDCPAAMTSTKPASAGQLNNQIQKGQPPGGVIRADPRNVIFQDQIHTCIMKIELIRIKVEECMMQKMGILIHRT